MHMKKQDVVCLRKTKQSVLPVKKQEIAEADYDVYPSFHLEQGKINEGFEGLVDYIIQQKTVIIEGYAGIFWEQIKEEIRQALPQNTKIHIQETKDWFLPEERIAPLLQPYLGAEDSVWGTRCDKKLMDLFDKKKIRECQQDSHADLNIIVGPGAAFSGWEAPIIYLDLPKNELQYRMRAERVTNLGSNKTAPPTQMYKRFFFVDWVLLNQHKKELLDKIEIIVDSQRPDTVTWMYFKDAQRAFRTMSENVFRVRPWFEPGAWGGKWLKRNLKGLNREEVNYAWSFELITPENGVLLESNGLLLEISFDFMMYANNAHILGRENAVKFGDDFPIRFDFLDTVKGGNLSIQCHPSLAYIKKHFGQSITQDETYYILDADEEASVYLGFQENIDPTVFRKKLENSKIQNIPVDISQYVQQFPAKKHDFFLIPNSTIHSAAAGNLVLEISATPYIFTFKMYDWLRLDLNGDPRPINIDHAFNNLNFERKGKKVEEELISKPVIIQSGDGWKQIHLPTHPDHFYDVHRYDFLHEVTISTEDSCHVLMLVEGESIVLKTKQGMRQRFHYAETFVVPAAAESYTLTNEGRGEAKVIKAFLKAESEKSNAEGKK